MKINLFLLAAPLLAEKMINKNLKLLIFDFLGAVETSLQLLEDKFGSRSLHQLWHDNKIAQRGEIFKGVSYQLHGNGCMIEYPEYCVDFDFGPNGRTDGFDAWRLYNYACEFPEKHAKYTNLTTVESELNQYIQENMVKKIDNSTSNLYFFTQPKKTN
jgi:hypothetical protein